MKLRITLPNGEVKLYWSEAQVKDIMLSYVNSHFIQILARDVVSETNYPLFIYLQNISLLEFLEDTQEGG